MTFKERIKALSGLEGLSTFREHIKSIVSGGVQYLPVSSFKLNVDIDTIESNIKVPVIKCNIDEMEFTAVVTQDNKKINIDQTEILVKKI